MQVLIIGPVAGVGYIFQELRSILPLMNGYDSISQLC